MLRSETYVSPTLRERQAPEPQRSAELEQDKLSEREREVLCRLAQGQRAKDIARELGISVKTVETHRSRLMLKLGIDNLVGLVKFAIRAGLVSSD